MNIQLRKAEGHHEANKARYKEIIEKEIKKAGSVSALARQSGYVRQRIEEARDSESYTVVRNCVHRIAGVVK